MKDKKWIEDKINTSIDRSHKQFQKDTDRYLATLFEKSEHDMLALKEFMSEFPTRTEVREITREIIREETAPIVRDVFRNEILPYLKSSEWKPSS